MEGIVTAILSGAVVAAIVTGITNIVLWKLNRKAKLEDDKTSKEALNIEESLKEIIKKVSDLEESSEINRDLSKKCFRILFSAQIRDIATKALRDGELSMTQKETIHELHSAYHTDCGGNGFFDELMKDIDSLPVKSR